ncbi:MAG TPA: DUF1127 domain-containing protein [Pseudaminobacter sp.]|nr:DUF1127 domain-containing protein [Pseudaminobacter sp.]
MSAKLLSLIVDPFRGWLCRRAERKALLTATDELTHLPDDMLNDIGISRDEIMALSAVAKRRCPDRIRQESERREALNAKP